MRRGKKSVVRVAQHVAAVIRDEGSYTLSHTRTTNFLPRCITIVARTGRRTEQASSDEGLSCRPKCQGKNVGCVEVIVSFVTLTPVSAVLVFLML